MARSCAGLRSVASSPRYRTPHARNLPLPVISRRPSSPTRLSAPCFEIFSASWIMPVETSGRDRTSSTKSGSFELARRSRSRRSIWVFARIDRSCSFRPARAASWTASTTANSRSLRLRARRRSRGMFLAEMQAGEMARGEPLLSQQRGHEQRSHAAVAAPLGATGVELLQRCRTDARPGGADNRLSRRSTRHITACGVSSRTIGSEEAALATGVRSDLSEGERRQKLSDHSLRAGLALSAEVDERNVQKHLGHASAEMTRKYQRRRDRFRVNLTKASGL